MNRSLTIPALSRALAAVALLLAPSVCAQESQAVTSFENDEQMRLMVPRDTRIELVSEGVTDGSRALLVHFSAVQWPALFFRPPQPWDLRLWGEIAVDVTNPEDQPASFYLRVDDDSRADGTRYCRTGNSTLAPGETRTFSFPLNGASPQGYGMIGLPAWPGTSSLGSNGSWTLDLSHIVQFQVFMSSPGSERTLILDNVRFRAGRSLDKILDRFGQFTGDDWPGKLYSEDEFAVRRDAEVQDLASHPPPAGRDRFGGWEGGPRLPATGFFRTDKVDGKWWLVTPEGHLFFSTGVDVVGVASPTFITGRESMFTWLPAGDDPLARFFGAATSSTGQQGTAYDFHSANIVRKDGDNWTGAWRDVTLARLRSWGFNTVANWSDSALYSRGVPYVTTTHYWGTYNTLGAMPDPFDPRFGAAVQAQLRSNLSVALGDPWCLGHFVDNELPWGNASSDGSHFSLPLAALGQTPAPSPARSALLDLLRTRYTSISALNSAWGSAAAGWDSLRAPDAPFNAAVKRDLSDMLRLLARQYFSTVNAAIKDIDPDHLYLGSRFSGNYSIEVVEAAAAFADVVSFNIYQNRIDPSAWDWLNALDKPAIIGEFHFGALDRGMFHPGLVAAPDQAGRARMFQDYLTSVLEHPAFVGAHWFQYMDEPVAGRTLDGENYNIGLLSVTDTPYPELIDAVREIHARMYEVRQAAGEQSRTPRCRDPFTRSGRVPRECPLFGER